MPVPTLITSLSTSAASNSPDGSESVITTDDYVRALSAFIAQLRDGSAFTGTVAAPTAVRVNGATQGQVGTRASGGSGQTANVNFDDMIVDGSTNSGLSILSGASSTGGLIFGDSGAASAGGMRYAHTTDELSLWASGAARVDITSAGAVTNVPLFVRIATATGQTANTGYDDLIVDSTSNSGLSFLGSTSSLQGVIFADTDSNAQGRVLYAHSTDTLSLWAGGSSVVSITSAGFSTPVLCAATSGASGYTTGAGSTVVQGTSLATAVTVTGGRPTWKVTTFAGSLGPGVSQSFTVNNSLISESTIVLVQGSAGLTVTAEIAAVSAGSCLVRLTNRDTGFTLTGPWQIRFALIQTSDA